MKFILTAWKGRNARAERIERVLETLFLALSGVYMIYLFTGGLTTLYMPYPLHLETAMIGAMAALAVPRLALIGPMCPELWLAAGLALIYNAVHASDGYGFLWFLAVLSAGYVRVDYRRILKTWLIAVGGAFIVTVLAALTGGIDNIVYYRDGLRSSWGICYPTDLASLGLFLLMLLWVVWRGLPDWAALIFGAASIALSAGVTRSRNGLACGVLFCAAIAYCWFERGFMTPRKRLRWVARGVDGLLIAAYPLFAGAFFLMLYLYAKGNSAGLRLDALLSGRLDQCLAGLRLHGVRAFGTPFEQIGNGFTVFPQLNVNFIDSSYVLIPVRYGWVLFAALGALWCRTVYRAVKVGERRLALAMGLIAFHAMLEHHFTEVYFNVLVAMPFAAYGSAPADAAKAPRAAKRLPKLAAAAVWLAGLWGAAPWLLTRLRTLFQARDYVGGGAGAPPMVAMLLAVALWWAAVLWLLGRALSGRGRARRAAAAALLLCAGVAGGACAWGGREIDRAAADSAALIQVDAPALERLLDAAENPVYADALPAVYQRRFHGIRDSALPLEDLARCPGCTVLTDAVPERNVFFHCGFRYARISDQHAVYTADPGVIAALTEAGYAPSEFYNAVWQVDLAAAAERNGLALSGDGLLLDGPERSLTYGEPRDLYSGLYTAACALRLPEGAADAPGEVCLLRATAYEGEMFLAELPIYREQFDAEGRLTASLSFEIGYAQGVEFLAFADDGRQLCVEEIRCAKERG